MKSYRHLLICILFVFAAAEGKALSENDMPNNPSPQIYLSAERIIIIEEYKTSLSIRTNTQGAAVYIDGAYRGQTPCSFTNIAPGVHSLEIAKRGYESKSFFINLNAGQNASFYIELEKTSGFILLSGVPDGSAVYIDGEALSFSSRALITQMPFEADEGYHTVSVKKFGYNDFTSRIYVMRRLVAPLEVRMTKAQFSLSGFAVSKERFNPSYGGQLGSCTFSFRVTAPENAMLVITDVSGKAVRTYRFPQFTTWDQRFTWDGTDDAGEIAADGVYTATISAASYVRTARTEIDSSLVYRIPDASKSGGGIGTLAAAYTTGEHASVIGIEAFPTFTSGRSGGTSLYAIPINMFFGITPVPWFECMFSFGIHAGMEEVPISLNASMKFGSSTKIGKDGRACFAGFMRFGYTTNSALYEPFGADTGNGFGTGFVFGIDGKKTYVGMSSEYVYDFFRKNPNGNNSVWKNGAAVEFRAVSFMTFKAWCALHSSFGGNAGIDWFRAIDTGGGITWKLGSSSAFFNLRGSALIYMQGKTYFSSGIGLTYLF